jgi:hypothetical protein
VVPKLQDAALPMHLQHVPKEAGDPGKAGEVKYRELLEERLANNWTNGGDVRSLMNELAMLQAENELLRKALKAAKRLIVSTSGCGTKFEWGSDRDDFELVEQALTAIEEQGQ